MSDLRVTLIQSDLHWQQPTANLAMFEEKIWAFDRETDVIVLPEMFTTGFTMEASSNSEPMGTGTFRWMQQLASQTKAAITGSYIVKDRENYFNRMLWVTPDGNYSVYDKRHLFRMAGEHQVFGQGRQPTIVEWRGWRIRLQICYDLRFPVWSRNRNRNKVPEYDLLIYVANWPAARVSAWDVLLQARAIENASYCMGINRIGRDQEGIDYNGHSAAIDPKGEVIYRAGEEEAMQRVDLKLSELREYRQKFPVHLDADEFDITI